MDRPAVDVDFAVRRAFVASLLAELFQAERSAELQCTREAKRHLAHLRAAALWTIARQANASLVVLAELAHARGLPGTERATWLGSFFSGLREGLLDRLLSAERSWRATLLGLRHGVDVTVSLRLAADALGDEEVVVFCDELLVERTPLVEEVADCLWWFADHPRLALAPAVG